MVENHEVIYVGQVEGKENVYGYIHATSSTSSTFHFGMNLDYLCGYLEGAFNALRRNVEIANGVPSHVKGSAFPNITVSRLDLVTLDKLLEDSGIKNKLQFSIRQY